MRLTDAREETARATQRLVDDNKKWTILNWPSRHPPVSLARFLVGPERVISAIARAAIKPTTEPTTRCVLLIFMTGSCCLLHYARGPFLGERRNMITAGLLLLLCRHRTQKARQTPELCERDDCLQ